MSGHRKIEVPRMTNGVADIARQITFGKQRINYDLAYSGRKTLAIHVNPNKSVSVIAPYDSGDDEIHKRVQKRAPWIVKQQNYFEEFHPLPEPLRFVSGETHLFLGRQYRLKLLKSSDRPEVKLVGPFIRVFLADKTDSAHVERLLDGWYRERAEQNFTKRLGNCLANAKSLNLDNPGFSIRKMKRRWGSCTKTGRILLNLHLIKTPGYAIEYVIMHELCHLKVHNHSPKFYRLLSRCMPDWEHRKRKLAGFLV